MYAVCFGMFASMIYHALRVLLQLSSLSVVFDSTTLIRVAAALFPFTVRAYTVYFSSSKGHLHITHVSDLYNHLPHLAGLVLISSFY